MEPNCFASFSEGKVGVHAWGSFEELARVSAVVAAGMVGAVSLGNALGRVFWAWASDMITRKATFFVMFLVQALLFWFLPSIRSAGILTVVAFIILLCYG